MKRVIALAVTIVCVCQLGYCQDSIESAKNMLASKKSWKLYKIVSDGDTTAFSYELFLRFESPETGNRKESVAGAPAKEVEVNFKYKIEEKDDEFILAVNNLVYVKGSSESAVPKFSVLKKSKLRFVKKENRDFLRLTTITPFGNRPPVHYYFLIN